MGIAANDIEYSELIENFAVHFGHANVALRGRSMRPLRWPIQFFYAWPLSLLGRPKASARCFFRMDLDKCIKSNLGTTCNPALINVSTICIDVKRPLFPSCLHHNHCDWSNLYLYLLLLSFWEPKCTLLSWCIFSLFYKSPATRVKYGLRPNFFLLICKPNGKKKTRHKTSFFFTNNNKLPTTPTTQFTSKKYVTIAKSQFLHCEIFK